MRGDVNDGKAEGSISFNKKREGKGVNHEELMGNVEDTEGRGKEK